MKENEIGTILVDRAVELHRDLGPGLLETVYELTLARALELRGLHIQRQVGDPIEYQGQSFDEGFRADLIVEGLVILELKSVEGVTPAHKKQLLTYLRLTGLKLGYWLNFGEALMRDRITRTINGHRDSDPPVSWCLCERRIHRTVAMGGCARRNPAPLAAALTRVGDASINGAFGVRRSGNARVAFRQMRRGQETSSGWGGQGLRSSHPAIRDDPTDAKRGRRACGRGSRPC